MYNPSRMDVKKRIYLVIAMIFGIALLTAGTLAWRSMPPVRQKHDYSVKLNQLFEPVKDWKQGETIPQNVSVTNLENSHDEIFVRLSLKEFMKTTQPSEGFIKDKSGEIILFATFAEGEQMGEFLKTQDAKTVMPDHQYGSMLVQTGIDRNGDPVYTDYATTNHTEVRNGIYGKPMTVPGTVVRIWGTPFDGGNTIHEIPDNTVCDYEAYSWDGRGALSHDGEQGGIRDYITFTGAQITKLADWAAQDEPEWGDFWIVDPHDGWAYWGRPLAPGITTDDFIEAVTLQQSPAAETDRFDYWMHIDLQAIGGPLEDFVQELPFFYDDEYDEVGGNRDDKQTLLDKMLGFISNRDSVDRSRLEAAIDLAGELEEKQEDYTVGSWNAMQDVLTESSRVYHDPDAKQFEITDAAIALEDAIDALVDLSALKALVAEADELVQEHYSEESWGPFAEALRHATEDVLADENATQDQVEGAWNELNERMSELTVDRSRLEAAIDLAGELEEKQEDYTVGSWNAMQDVLTESSRVYHDPDAKQFEITDVAIALEDAIDALVDLTKLQAALADAEQKKETDYTFDSWDRFVPVWDLAQEVRNDPNATQEQVDQAEGDLILAMLALNTAIIQTPNPALRAVATGRRVLHRDTGIGNMMEVAQYRSPGTTDLPEGKIYSFVMAEDTDDALQYWGFTERNVTHYMNLSLTGEMLAYSVRWRANSLWNPQPESMVYIPEFAHIRNYAMTNNVPTSEQATAPWTGSPPAQDEGYSIPVRKAIMSDDGRSPDTDVAIPISGQEAYYYYSLHSDVGSQNIDRNRMRSDLWLRSRGSSDEYCYLSKGSHETPGQIIMQEGQNLLEGSRVAMWVDSSIFAEFLNREDLGGLINRADNLESDDYTVESWEVLTEAISQATAVHQKEEASQRQVDLAARLLQQAIHNLVSRTALRKEIESLNDRTPSHYTQASYEDALQVLSHAASVYEDPNATREQVNEAGDALAQVMSEMVDVRLLRETIDQAEQKDSEGYTSGSWTNFAQALHEAKEVINRSDASQQHVNDHLAALQSATQALIPELQAVHGRMLLNAATDAGVWHEMARYGDYSLILSGEDLLYLGHPWDDSLQRDSYLSLPLQGNNIRARANDHWTAVTSTSIPRSAQMRQYAVISDQLDDASGGSIPGDADAQVDDTDVVFPLSEYEAMTYYSKHSAIGIQNFGRHVNDNSQWLRSVSFEKQPAYIRGGDADVNPGFVFYADVTQRMGFRPAMWVRSSIFTGDAAIEGMALNGLIEQGKHRLQEMPAAQNKSSLESMITDAQRIVENPETTQQQLTDAVERFQRVLHQVESAHE